MSTITKTITPEGDTLATTEGIIYPLTPCHQASGKGSSMSETGVVCRACYADVDPFYGMGWLVADFAEGWRFWGTSDPAEILKNLGL